MKTWSLVTAIVVLLLVGAGVVFLYPPYPDSGSTYQMPDPSQPDY